MISVSENVYKHLSAAGFFFVCAASFIVSLKAGFLTTLFLLIVLSFFENNIFASAFSKFLLLFCPVIFFTSVWFAKGGLLALKAFFLCAFFLIFYCGFRLLLAHEMQALLGVVLLTVTCSFLPLGIIVPLMIGMSLFFVSFFIFFKSDLVYVLKRNHYWLSCLSSADILSWFIIFLSVTFLAISSDGNYMTYDDFHPLYELSIGQSYKKTLFNVPDVSYAGKSITYHFLSTRLPLFFAQLFNINLLDAVYFFVPLFLLLIMFVVINIFFIYFPFLHIPILILLFFPLWKFWQLSDCIYYRTLHFAPSYFLGFLLLVLAFYFLIKHQLIYFVISMVALLLTKASFFIPMFLGTVLLFFYEKQWKRLFIVASMLSIIFIVCFFLFLSGAHGYNLWLVFPGFANIAFFISNNVHPEWFLFAAVLLFFVGWKFLKAETSWEIRCLSSVALSALLFCFAFAEITENNGIQVYIAAFFPIVLLLWHGFKSLMNNNQVHWTFKVCSLGLLSFITFTSARFQLLQGWDNAMFMVSPHKTLQDNVLLSKDMIDAYSWFGQHETDNDVVLFGKHYEVRGKNWRPRTGFVRSAVSGVQMLCENYVYKSSFMQKDYSERFAQTILFYKNYVDLTEQSKKRLMPFDDVSFGKEPGIPLDQEVALRKKALYFLSFGKKWYMKNRCQQVEYEIRQHLERDAFTDVEAKKFLRTHCITHIVLENGDKPTEFLDSITHLCYANNNVAILEVT